MFTKGTEKKMVKILFRQFCVYDTSVLCVGIIIKCSSIIHKNSFLSLNIKGKYILGSNS